DDFGPFADLVLGSRPAFDGFLMPDGRFITRELVVFNEPRRAARSLLWFHGRGPSGDEEPPPTGVSVAAVVRDGDGTAWQIGENIHLYDVATGKRAFTRPGNLLRRCDSGRIAAWSKDATRYRVFDLRTDATIGEVPRETMLVLGVDAACSTLFTQSLDGV